MEMLEILVQSKLSINFVSVNNYFQYEILVTQNQIFLTILTLKRTYSIYCIAIPLWFSCKLGIEK